MVYDSKQVDGFLRMGERNELSQHVAGAAKRVLALREKFRRSHRSNEHRVGYMFDEERFEYENAGYDFSDVAAFAVVSPRELVPRKIYARWRHGDFTEKDVTRFFIHFFPISAVTHLVVAEGWELKAHATLLRSVAQVFSLEIYEAKRV